MLPLRNAILPPARVNASRRSRIASLQYSSCPTLRSSAYGSEQAGIPMEVEIGAVVDRVAVALEPRDQRRVPVRERLAPARGLVRVGRIARLHDAAGAAAGPAGTSPCSPGRGASRRPHAPRRRGCRSPCCCRRGRWPTRACRASAPRGPATGGRTTNSSSPGSAPATRLAVAGRLDEQRDVRAGAPVCRYREVVRRPAPVAIGRPLGQSLAGRGRRGPEPATGSSSRRLAAPLDAKGRVPSSRRAASACRPAGPSAGAGSRGSR